MMRTIIGAPRVQPGSSWGPLSLTGLFAVLFAAILTTRIIWEETYLTLMQGPQMLGFSLAHGAWAILLLAPLVLAIWLIVAVLRIVFMLVRRRTVSRPFWCVFAAGLLTLGLISLPPVFWQWLVINQFSRSPHAADLMTYAAAEGDMRTVRGYLSHGVPLESVNYEGSTSVLTAAAGDRVPVLEELQAKGANLSAVNAYGDSPLEVAIEDHHASAAAFLKAHGALQIKGSPEQRQNASHAIVMKEIERSSRNR